MLRRWNIGEKLKLVNLQPPAVFLEPIPEPLLFVIRSVILNQLGFPGIIFPCQPLKEVQIGFQIEDGSLVVGEVRKGVRALLSLEDLELAIESLADLRSNLSEEIQKLASGEYQKAEIQLKECEDKIASHGKKATQLESEIQHAEEQIKEISEKLKQYEAVAALERQYEELQTQKRELTNQLSQIFADMQKALNYGGLIIAGPELAALHEDLQIRIDKSELPPPIKRDFIDNLLKNLACICGTHFTEQDPAYQQLVSFRDRVPSGDSKLLMGLYRNLAELLAARQYEYEKCQNTFQNWGKIRDELKEVDVKISGISDDIRSHGGDKEKDLEKARRQCQENLEGLKRESESLRMSILSEERRREDLRKDVQRLASQDRLAKQARDKRNLVEQTLETLKDLQNSYATKTRAALQDEATKIFQKLADETTKLTLSKILIESDYTLNVANWTGDSVLADISAGQRQIVSLAFIASLILTAGGKKDYEVPLFMDTPFGRLSSDHREALLANLPDLASQWIFLATDTELGESEYESLLKTSKWGAIYILEPKGPGESIATRQNIGQFRPKTLERALQQ